ncbi:hypothetical protein ACHHYP_07347 [Achlya hypogyna]|uniref:Uncharacterized protein n=1 Tax=Achlya hypogyna TaxID=1202772 RepID=A0A1V9ZLZ3_ACHHY|nr:hypothetical protein ACHHYP_07347 [Achlya hypogyna]
MFTEARSPIIRVDTQVYSNSANRIERELRHKDHQRATREDNLRCKTTSIPKLGYSYLVQDDSVKPPNVTKVCQERVKFPAYNVDTHGRLFNETSPVWYPERAQHLRNEGQAGRPFNVINGGRVDYYPPTIPEKQHPREAHPSMNIHSIYYKAHD